MPTIVKTVHTGSVPYVFGVAVQMIFSNVASGFDQLQKISK